MGRTKSPTKLPDAINCSSIKDFTQVPNKILRNSEVSLKAKGLLSLLLSNKEGEWKSYIEGLNSMTKDGKDSINSGLKELEEYGYLLRLRYRSKKTGNWVGSFWAYTDEPFRFYIKENAKQIFDINCEIVVQLKGTPHADFPDMEIPDRDNPDRDNPRLIILNYNNIKKEKISTLLADVETSPNNGSSNGLDKRIVPSQFEKFWNIYPKKVDKGKAYDSWKRLCSSSSRAKERPTWREVKSAIRNQKKTERWQEIKFIPNPSTWLNQNRWLDDPKEMRVYKDSPNEKLSNFYDDEGHYWPT